MTVMPTNASPDAYIKATALGLARRFLGVHEVDGPRSNPVVLAMLRGAAGDWVEDDDTAWCGAFVWSIAHLLELPVPKEPAHARSWLSAGTPVRLDQAVPGFDVVVFKRGGPNEPGPEVLAAPGHVAFYVGRDERGAVVALGGNQGDAVSVESFPPERVLGIRRL